MNKEKRKLIYDERLLLVIAFILFLLTLGAVIYSLGFLSKNILPVFSGESSGGGEIKFDLEGFKNLGL